MELWNEYEGRTIAGSFKLQKLLRPEGRSAFFSTTTPAGAATVIRLIESHYDDDVILARWNAVASLHHPNLLTLNHFGPVTLDDTALVYAVMEPTDADLSQILRERRLTVTETHQLASSLVSALQALHSLGLVHEHVQPMHVLAVGETVKLRSDCIREAPDGEDAHEGDRARARDVHDLAILLLQALTLERDPAAIAPPPAPFRDIIANGINAQWGLREIARALASTAPPASHQPTPQPHQISQPRQVPQPQQPPAPSPATPVIPPTRPAANLPAPNLRDRLRASRSSRARRNPSPGSALIVGAAGAALLLLLLVFLWHLTHHHPASQAAVSQTAPAPLPATTPAPLPSDSNRPLPSTAANHKLQWRVVAYTYNHEDQARAKATQLASQHRDLHLDVFSPTGRAPYLVTVGGPMTREAAFTLRSQLRGKGFPRDLYAQNFASR